MQEKWNQLMKKRCIIWLIMGVCTAVICQCPTNSQASRILDKYANFAELAENEIEGEDYRIEYTDMGTDLLILSPHGGGIEGGVSELVHAFSNEYSTYLFEGIKPAQNWDLHVTSNHFDEPTALEKVSEHRYVLAFHGYDDTEEHTLVGGTDREGGQAIADALEEHGFSVELVGENHKFAGTDPENLNNKCKTGLSIQLEISTPQREAFFSRFGLWTRESSYNKLFYDYAAAIKEVLEERYK
ncbi:poly-gamma-glutamate hydrolase family protein [Bacillus swezeyi]|uniref:poly-gamma-glutamate hydrolase family protein n=1 Tax=Bacillus swezeyi TaxID=1925020 RepID=UPI0027DE7BD9|nr:poly-gamma-glutamate hydrolase family protein [Bacillus swezeyi]